MWRVVDIEQPDCTLSLDRGNLVVRQRQDASVVTELGRVAISDIHAVIVHGYGCMLSLNLSAALADANVAVVMADKNHQPKAIFLPVSSNYEHALRLTAQAEASRAKQKSLWRDVVRAKISAQSEVLEMVGHKDAEALRKLCRVVKPGDPENVEARAARYYWQRLFGKDFRRNTDGEGLNGSLNYGYAIIRATVARSVVASGLSPGLGIHHRSRLNPFQLVDDLMEPLRPVVDICVWRNRDRWADGLPREGKPILTALVNASIKGVDGVTTLSNVAHQISYSLSEVFLGTRKTIWLPNSIAEVKQDEFGFIQQS